MSYGISLLPIASFNGGSYISDEAVLVIGLIMLALLCLPLVAYPMARAFLAGLKAARAPEIRLTPAGSMPMFRRRFLRSCKWWLIWFCPLMLIVMGFVRYRILSAPAVSNAADQTPWINLFDWPFSALTFWLILFAVMMRLAPWFRFSPTLALFAWLLVLPVFGFFSWIVYRINTVGLWPFVMGSPRWSDGKRAYLTPWLEVFGLALPLVLLSIFWTRNLGNAWFRAKE